jgi:2-iminobutanoate/2-iminopropanoate deaminase
MTKAAIVSQKLAPPVGPFSQGTQDGEFIFLSGQIGQDPATGQLVEGGVSGRPSKFSRT